MKRKDSGGNEELRDCSLYGQGHVLNHPIPLPRPLPPRSSYRLAFRVVCLYAMCEEH